MYGQTVNKDWKNCIVYSMQAWHPYQSFAGCRVIHRDIGCRMRRVGPTMGWDPVPAKILRLILMWETCLAYHVEQDTHGTTTLCVCRLCGQHDLEQHKTFTCSMCLLTWHDRCSRRLARSCHGACAARPELPEVLCGDFSDANTCHLCQPMFRTGTASSGAGRSETGS